MKQRLASTCAVASLLPQSTEPNRARSGICGCPHMESLSLQGSITDMTEYATTALFNLSEKDWID